MLILLRAWRGDAPSSDGIAFVAVVRRQLSLSDEATAALERELPRHELMDESFRFDAHEFDTHIAHRTSRIAPCS